MISAAGLSQADQAKIHQAMQTPKPCLLCGQPPTVAGLFWPDAPLLWGGKPGKGRVIAYWLCTHCRDVPGVTDRVEARLQAHIVGRRN
jgi:hypothetical protein